MTGLAERFPCHKAHWRVIAYYLAVVLGLLVLVSSPVRAEESASSTEQTAIPKEDNTSGATPEADKVEITSFVSPVYNDGAANRTLLIRGTGLAEGIKFEFDPPIGVEKRMSTKLITDRSGQPGYEFRLVKGKTWLKQSPKLPFEFIYVVKATRNGKVVFNPKKKVAIAKVFPRPELVTPYESAKITYNQGELVIHGVNLSPKDTKFVFDPPLEAIKDYTYVINNDGTQMTLTLKGNAKWRTTSGSLNVVAIHGGAGRLDLPSPVTVADVTVPEGAESEENDVEGIVPPEKADSIYRSYKGTSQITIHATGLKADRPPTIGFAREAARQGVDFDLTVVSKTELILRLRKDKFWLAKPGVLTISEFNGDVLPFPIDIAEVYDTPDVRKDRQQLAYESQTLTITIKGEGFDEDNTHFGFNPELKVGEDCTIEVRDTRTVELELVKGKKWPRGTLHVLWVQVGDAPKIYLNKEQPEKGLRVALVEPDFGGVIQIKASKQRVYQSKTQLITVDVEVLPPKYALTEGEDVRVEVELATDEPNAQVAGKAKVKASLAVSDTSAAQLKMELRDPQTIRWMNTQGRLLLNAIWLPVPGDEDKKPIRYPLGAATSLPDGSKESIRGVQIARVMPDISVNYFSPAPIVFASQTTVIKITGSGFTYSMGNTEDLDEDEDVEESGSKKLQPVVLDPPLVQDEDFFVLVDSDAQITLMLQDGKRWRQTPGELRLVSLDSGAGPVLVDAAIARVAEDDPETLCSNDCPFGTPSDGFCDDMKMNPRTGDYDCWGMDCDDCGPRKKSHKPDANAPNVNKGLCSDSCGAPFAKDGVCEDGRPGAAFAQCPLCSDCSDCGPCEEEMYKYLPLCTNGVEGSPDALEPGIPCHFPFEYKGVLYDGTSGGVKDGRVSGGWGWCPTTENYERDGSWGSCQYCADVLSDPSVLEKKLGNVDDYAYGGEKETSLRNKSRDKKQGFDFVRWLVNTLFFLVVFGAIGALVLIAYRRRGGGFRYQVVDSKSS